MGFSSCTSFLCFLRLKHIKKPCQLVLGAASSLFFVVVMGLDHWFATIV